MDIAEALGQLQNLLQQDLLNPSAEFWDDMTERAEAARVAAIDGGDVNSANKAWFLRTVAEARGRFVGAFQLINQGECYKAWCDLEKVEIALPWLMRNPFYEPKTFNVEELMAKVAQWQSLFPYKVFFSPGFIHKKKHCSICETVITPWSSCTHERGFVYGGRACTHVVTMSEFLEISLVLDPVQKYSVGFAGVDADGNRVDHHDYSIVGFLADRLASPFDEWTADWTEAYHPHAMFPDATPEGPCPCESGRSYKSCCQLRQGVIRPHIQFGLAKTPPRELPNAAFAGYGGRNGPAKLTEEMQSNI